MADPMTRFWERFNTRAKLGGRRLYETRQRTKEWTGEGGVKLTEAEKQQLFQQGVDDPSGRMFEEIGRNRQAANKLEGTTEIPADLWEWLKDRWAKMQQQGEG